MKLTLPGIDAQLKMAPPFRSKLLEIHKYKIKKAKRAAVMVLFYPDFSQQIKLVLILRSDYQGIHANQIGFPGGKPNNEDGNLLETALRETREEIGILESSVKIAGSLTSLYIPPSNFNVFPFVGFLNDTPQFVLQAKEVKAIIEVPLDSLISDKNIIHTTVAKYDSQFETVPAFKFNDYKVWGATAMILAELKTLIQGNLKK